MVADGPSRFKSRFSLLSLLPTRHPPIVISNPQPIPSLPTQHIHQPRDIKQVKHSRPALAPAPISPVRSARAFPCSPITNYGPFDEDPFTPPRRIGSPGSSYTNSPGGRRGSPRRPPPLDLDKVRKAYPPKDDVLASATTQHDPSIFPSQTRPKTPPPPPPHAPSPPILPEYNVPKKVTRGERSKREERSNVEDPFEIVQIEPGHKYSSWQRGKIDIKPGQIIPRSLMPPSSNYFTEPDPVPEDTYDSVLADVLLTPTYLRPSPNSNCQTQWSPASSPSSRQKRKTLLGKVGQVVSTAARKSAFVPKGILKHGGMNTDPAERSLKELKEREAREMDRYRLAQHKAGVDIGRSYSTSLSPVLDMRAEGLRRSPGYVGHREQQVGIEHFEVDGKKSNGWGHGGKDDLEKVKRKQKIWKYSIVLIILALAALIIGLCTSLLTRSSGSSTTSSTSSNSTSSSSSLSSSQSTTASPPTSTSTSQTLTTCLQQFSSSAPTSPLSYSCSDCVPLLSSAQNDFTVPLVGGNSTGVGAALQFCALLDVYRGTQDVSGLKTGGWAGNASPCDGWSGVTCDSRGRITELTLKYPNVPTTLPDSLINIISLQTLHLTGNSSIPSGPFPNALTKLSNLTVIDIEYTALTGPLSNDAFESASKLQALFLVYNAQLGTTLPNLVNSKSLTTLAVTGQRLTNISVDQLPSSLTYLDLSFNSLSGQIPSFSQLTSLQTLLLENDSFTSPPTSLPSTLSTLSLTSNPALSGSLPASVCSSTTLTSCDLRSTLLSASSNTTTTTNNSTSSKVCGQCKFQ
ncbi:hypothetical protein M231_01865 [Tremella mesenterica]|uniref:Uncharacterized protein n=1 Tax=Tremella mesenterica TaxID=5217 RepID=A0A4Q1BS87_TREME|nr:hypothetical protein M231_01865 [Tremella mesenterica]